MAIGYGRAVFIQRSEGESVLLAAAYVSRTKARLGDTFVDYSDRHDLLLPARTILPQGAPDRLTDPMVLWREMEAAATRKDSVLGQHIILALPDASGFDSALHAAMIEEFIREMITPHRLAASFAIHAPHLLDPQTGSTFFDRLEGRHGPEVEVRLARANVHAHIVASPRQVGPLGLAAHRYYGLEPRHGFRAAAAGSDQAVAFQEVFDGIEWGKRWATFQNDFFGRRGLALRVRPQVSFRASHLGAKAVAVRRKEMAAGGASAPFGPTIDPIVERANRAIVANPDGLLSLVKSAPFRRADISSLVDRFLDTHPQPEAVVTAALSHGRTFEIGDRVTGSSMGWHVRAELAQDEQRVLALAAALSERGEELPARHCANEEKMFTAIARDSVWNLGLAMIDCADDAAPELRRALADAATDSGLGSVAMGHGFGQQAEFRASFGIGRLLEQEPRGNVIILDFADGCAAADLVLVLEAALSKPEGRAVLLRRPNRSSCPRNSLLDLVARLAYRHTVPEQPAPNGTRALLRSRRWLDAVRLLHSEGFIHLKPRPALVETMLEIATAPEKRNWGIETADADLLEILGSRGLAPRSPVPSGRTVLVHGSTAPQLPPVLARLQETVDVLLLVDNAVAPDLEALAAQLELACGPRSAITFPLAVASTAASRERPYISQPQLEWTIDGAGRLVTDADAILDLLEDELRSTPRLIWTTPRLMPVAPKLRAKLASLLLEDAADVGLDVPDDASLTASDDVRPEDFENLPDRGDDEYDHDAADLEADPEAEPDESPEDNEKPDLTPED